jgi:polyhydroxyalkanoate synthesis regulator protein
MSDKSRSQGNELFQQAMKNYEQALQAGLKLQQDSGKLWMDMMAQAGSPQEWQSKANEVASESLSMARTRMEENLKLVEQSSRSSLDLLKQAMEATKADTIAAGQNKMQELWESSLEAVRANATAINQANAKWAEAWMQMMPKTKSAASAKPAAA